MNNIHDTMIQVVCSRNEFDISTLDYMWAVNYKWLSKNNTWHVFFGNRA